MEQILIDLSFYLKMRAVEKEDYLPSTRMELELRKKHSTGSYIYTANDIWFDAASWNKFVLSLKKLIEEVNTKAILYDMSNLFSMTIENSNKEFTISLICKEPIVGQSNSSIILTMQENIDAETVYFIKESFKKME